MPIYEYACEACGHRFEKLMKMGAEAPPCPSCAATSVRKLVSSTAFVLKGGGWYKDHYGLKKGEGGKSEAGGKPEGGGAPAEGGAKPPAEGAKASTPAPSPATPPKAAS